MRRLGERITARTLASRRPALDHPVVKKRVAQSGSSTLPKVQRLRVGPLAEADMLPHVTAMHEGMRGKIGLARDFPNGMWKEESVAFDALVGRLSSLVGQPDTYVSMNHFWGPRRAERLATCSALYSDIDYYKSGYAHLSPEQAHFQALEKLDDAGIPPPSLVLFSGRGLTLIWLHSPIRRTALPRWNLCQDQILDALCDLGADPCSRDVTRVFRLAGTVNSKSGKAVRFLSSQGTRWDFDDLADEILPLTRHQINELRAKRGAKTARQRRKPVCRHSAESLWQVRLQELQRLAASRWPHGIPRGHRDQWLLVASIALSWLVPAHSLDQHVIELAGQYCPGWSDRMTRSCMGSIQSRARRSGNGERLSWKGRDVDPRYRLTTGEIIKRLAITADEMRSLDFRSLVVPDRRRALASSSRRKNRRARGSVDRDTYEAKAKVRRAEAHQLNASGLSWSEVGAKLGISAEAARKRASRHVVSTEPDRSVTVYSGVAMPSDREADHHAETDAGRPSTSTGPVARVPEYGWARPPTHPCSRDHDPGPIMRRFAVIGRTSPSGITTSIRHLIQQFVSVRQPLHGNVLGIHDRMALAGIGRAPHAAWPWGDQLLRAWLAPQFFPQPVGAPERTIPAIVPLAGVVEVVTASAAELSRLQVEAQASCLAAVTRTDEVGARTAHVAIDMCNGDVLMLHYHRPYFGPWLNREAVPGRNALETDGGLPPDMDGCCGPPAGRQQALAAHFSNIQFDAVIDTLARSSGYTA